jgi:phospholipid/cholesterol/gamma-HCH transport system substrate-binding protein
MMLSRFVRWQLIIFSVLTVIGVVAMATIYVKAPAMLGIGRYKITVQLESTGGLYSHANVSYRGTNVGEVEAVRLTPTGVDAELSIGSDYKIPADSRAVVKSVSAVGEQYVDLIPNSDEGPDFRDGDTVAVSNTALPQDVGPMLDQMDRLLRGIADTRLATVVDEAFKAFNGAGPDLQKFLDSAYLFIQEADANSEQTKTLIDQVGPLLDTQVDTSDAIRSWTQDLMTFTDQLRVSDPVLRSVIERGPGAANEANQLFQDLRPTLPIFLANLVSVGEVSAIYHSGIEQILVVYPPLIAALYTAVTSGPLDEGALVDFHLELNDPPACTTGFLPPDQRRAFTDYSVPPTPPGLFCKVAPEGPEAVRGARNTPCMEVPGKRAPSPEICRSDQEYVPLGNNPALGPPQPIEGFTPSSYEPGAAVPGATARPYDPQNGIFIGPDGQTYREPGLAQDSGEKPSTGWQTVMTEQLGL